MKNKCFLLLLSALLMSAGLGIFLFFVFSHTVYQFPPDVSEWFFIEPPEEIVEKYDLGICTYAKITDDGTIVMVVNPEQEQVWIERMCPNDCAELAAENQNVSISNDFKNVTVTCYNEATWENDVLCAENVLFYCILKQLFNGCPPEELGVYFKIVDGPTEKTVLHIYWQGQDYWIHPSEFSFLH